MRLFGRRTQRSNTPASTGNADDDAALRAIAAQSSLLTHRHWIQYLYCRDEAAARTAAEEIKAGGWKIRRADKAAKGAGWVVVAERYGAIVSPAAVRDARIFFEGVAARVADGEYDGWDASA